MRIGKKAGFILCGIAIAFVFQIKCFAATSQDGGIVSFWDSKGFSENKVQSVRSMHCDEVNVYHWSIGKPFPADSEIPLLHKKFKKYIANGISLEIVGIATDGAVRPTGEYLKKNPERRQWFYKWITQKADTDELTFQLPKKPVPYKGNEKFFYVKDTTLLFDENNKIDFAVLHKDRSIPAKNWKIEKNKLILKSTPGHTYTAYIPCQSKLVTLMPIESQKDVCRKLDRFLSEFREIKYISWEAVASLSCYKGDTWADCSPVMQKLFKERTGFEFDPELVELDPLRWRAWADFKANTVAEAMKLITETLQKYNVGHDYYMGDYTYGGSYDSLGKAGVNNILCWSSTWNGKWEGGNIPIPDWCWEFIWGKTFWGNWEDKPGFSMIYWVYNQKRRPSGADNYDSMVRWWWDITQRGAVNECLPDKLYWGLNTCKHNPSREQLKAIHEINTRYKYTYNLLKKSKLPYIGTGYIPSLGPNLYFPSIYGMFTRQGYLWDVPIKWKHIDLKDLSQGKIPADCDLLLLPSESFMSGTIDSKCVEKIKEWVKKGHSLWVLRAAGYADIYGKDKKFTSLREITGIDYKKKDAANDLSKSVVKTAKGRSHEITSGLPEKSFLDIDRKWLVEFSHCKYDWWNSYYPTHPTEWFLGTQPSKYMIKQLLPSYYEYNGSGAVDFDNSCEILLKQGDAPFLAVKEFGKGKVAYLGREYNLSSDFGHMLLSKTAYWLMGKKANIECDNYNIDIALRKAADASFLILEYNPLEKQSAKGNIKIRNLDPQSKYIILNEKFPEFPGFLKSSKNKSIWTASEIEKKGYNIDLDSWQLGIQHLVPYKTKHLVFEHAFIDPSEGIEGSVSSFVKIKSFSKLSKGQYRLELISEEKSPLLVLPQNELRVSIAPEYSFSIYCDNERIGDFKSGKVLSSKEPVHFSYDSSKNLLSLKF